MESGTDIDPYQFCVDGCTNTTTCGIVEVPEEHLGVRHNVYDVQCVCVHTVALANKRMIFLWGANPSGVQDM